MASEEGWVGIADVAAHLGVAKDSVYRWVDSKDFPGYRVGRLLRFRLSEVDEWVRTGGGSDSRTHGVSWDFIRRWARVTNRNTYAAYLRQS